MKVKEFLELAEEISTAMRERDEFRQAREELATLKAEHHILKASVGPEQAKQAEHWQTAIRLLNKAVVLSRRNPAESTIRAFSREVDNFLSDALDLPKIYGDEELKQGVMKRLENGNMAVVRD